MTAFPPTLTKGRQSRRSLTASASVRCSTTWVMSSESNAPPRYLRLVAPRVPRQATVSSARPKRVRLAQAVYVRRLLALPDHDLRYVELDHSFLVKAVREQGVVDHLLLLEPKTRNGNVNEDSMRSAHLRAQMLPGAHRVGERAHRVEPRVVELRDESVRCIWPALHRNLKLRFNCVRPHAGSGDDYSVVPT